MVSLQRFQRLPAPLLETITRASPWTGPLGSSTARQQRTFVTADLSALDASKGDRERVIILGSGWAGRIRTLSTSYLLTQLARVPPVSKAIGEEIPDSGHIASITFRLHTSPQLYRRRHS